VVLAAVASGTAYWFWSQPTVVVGDRRVAQVAISPGGHWYAAGSVAGQFAIWQTEHPDQAQHFRIPGVTPHALAFSPDEKYLAIAHSQGLSVQTVQEMGSLRHLRSGAGFRAAAFSPRGRLLALSSAGSAEWWDLDSGAGESAACCAVGEGSFAFGKDGAQVALSGTDPSLWDANTAKRIGQLALGNAQTIFGPITFDFARGWILMGARDGRVYAWDAHSRALRAKSREPAGSVESVAALKKSPWVVFAKTGAPLHMWNPDTGELRSLEAFPYSNVVAGRQPASMLFGNYAGSVELWNAESGKVLSRFTLR